MTNAISKWRSFWKPFLRWPPKCVKISKCSNFNENLYVGLFPHEECDSGKSNLKMASYFFTGTRVLVYVMYQ